MLKPDKMELCRSALSLRVHSNGSFISVFLPSLNFVNITLKKICLE